MLQVVYADAALVGIGDPTGVVLPPYRGAIFRDIAGAALYLATGLTESDWEAVSSGGGGGPSAGQYLPAASLAGFTMDSTTYDDPILNDGTKMRVLVGADSDDSVLAIATVGDAFPRYLIDSSSLGGIYMGDGTFDPYNGPGANLWYSGDSAVDPGHGEISIQALLTHALQVSGGTDLFSGATKSVHIVGADALGVPVLLIDGPTEASGVILLEAHTAEGNTFLTYSSGGLFITSAPPSGDTVVAFGPTAGAQNATLAVTEDAKVGFFSVAPVVQQATPVTLGDVIAILQAFGLAA